MGKLIIGLLAVLGIMATVAFFALIGGTILFWIWPVAIPAAVPGLVASGAIAGKITWWASVCLVWLMGILVKSTNTNNCK